MIEEDEVLSRKVKVARVIILVAWILCMSLVVLGGMITFFNGEITFKSPDFEYLNNVGGFFNVVTSLTGVATVWLLAEAILLQKKELREVSSSMQGQNNKLQTQIDSSKDEEKINRAMKLYDEWLDVKNDTSSKREDTLDEILNKYNPVIHYIVRVTRIKNSSFSLYVNFDVLKEILDKEGVIYDLNFAKNKIENMKGEVEDECRKNIDKIRIYPPDHTGAPRKADLGTMLEEKTLIYSQNIEVFSDAVVGFEDAFK